MAVKVDMEVNVGILFGLESQVTELVEIIKSFVNKMKELVMTIKNENSCVWYGIAFLRGHGGTFQPLREMRHFPKYSLVNRDAEGFDSPPSHQNKYALVFHSKTTDGQLREPLFSALVVHRL